MTNSNAIKVTNNKTPIAKAATPKAANNNNSNALPQLKNNFNQWRGMFISIFSKYEFSLCEILHKIKKNTEIIKNELPSTSSARTDLLLNLVSEDNKLNSMLGQIKLIAKDIEKYENLRNILAHGDLSIMKDEDGNNVYMLLVFANNGQSPKKEVEFVDIAELKSISAKISKLIDDFRNHAKTIKKFVAAS